MCDQFLTYSNLLVYLGFNIAAFAFISQYLSFPKDILAELSRAKRDATLHEFPYEASRVTNNIENKEASDKIKAFFLEADTVTFAILMYLLFSIVVILLIIMANLLEVYSLKIVIVGCIMVCALLYALLIVYAMLKELFYNERKGPQKYQTDKNRYLITLMVLTCLFVIGVFFSIHHLESLFMLLIFGLLIHFVLYLLPIWSRMPVTNLLVLWENLLGAEQPKKKNQ